MILNLADAIEPSPFFLRNAASYLRDWINGTLTLVPPLDTSILTTRSRLTSEFEPVHNAGEVAALEPSVSNVRVERASAQVPQEVIVNPRMEVICGMATTLHNEGLNWTNSFEKAYELWGKLNPSVMEALDTNFPQRDVVSGAVAESTDSPNPPVVEDLEDDAALPLEPEVDR